jgi:hypothetical protein
MKRRAIAGIIALGIAAILLMIGLYYWQLSSMRYLNYLCPTVADCVLIRDTYLDLAMVFTISGGILGAIGAWLTITGLRAEPTQTSRQSDQN